MPSREYREKNPEQHRRYLRRWRKENPTYASDRHRELRVKALEAYGSKCAQCGENDPDILHLDHINNDGAMHRREVNGNIFRWLKNNRYPGGFQVLCANCNMKKEAERRKGGVPVLVEAPDGAKEA